MTDYHIQCKSRAIIYSGFFPFAQSHLSFVLNYLDIFTSVLKEKKKNPNTWSLQLLLHNVVSNFVSSDLIILNRLHKPGWRVHQSFTSREGTRCASYQEKQRIVGVVWLQYLSKLIKSFMQTWSCYQVYLDHLFLFCINVLVERE